MNTYINRALALSVLLCLHAYAQAGVVADHQGRWLGDMKIPNGPTLKIGAELYTKADGSAGALSVSPDQGGYDLHVQSVEETGDSALLDLSFAKLKLTWVKDHFNCELQQSGAVFPFEMNAVPAFPTPPRPQTPVAPFPYQQQTLTIASADGVLLGATLAVPNGVPHPNVVILVNGSGDSTRDENILGHQVFTVLADQLLRQGVAVLRYDKRGVGRSTGDYAQHTGAQLIDDLDAVAKALKARKQFKRVGLVGHSEGSGIAAAVAARDPQSVDFVVSMAGIGMSGLDTVLLQDRIGATDQGASAAEADRIMLYVRKFYAITIAHDDAAARVAALKAMLAALTPEDQALIKKYRMNVGSLSMAEAAKPAMRALLLSDPQKDWRRVRSPVLALNGSLDHQVTPDENLAGIMAALKAGGNRHAQAALLASLNHLFQTAKTGKVDEYGGIEQTIAPVVAQRIAQFTKQK